MSYDVYLVADLGGAKRSRVEHDHLNYTSNVVPMWEKAGAQPDDWDGAPAWQLAPILHAAAARMKADWAAYEAMNPANGWGDAAGACDFLERVALVCEEHPRATVAVWR